MSTAQRDPRDPRVGQVLDGLYRLDRLLGVGGVGAVYAAWHLHLERLVAVKLLHAQFAQHKEPLERFKREAQMLSRLGHESFVKVSDFTYARDGTPYLVMELLRGESLRQRLGRGPLSSAEALALFRPLCEALGQAHEQQILHRDLKPDNLMLDQDGGGVVKILDFGMARLMSDEVVLTQDKVVMGTPNYMAPERAKGRRDIGPSSDIFSLGAILYEALTARMAFPGEGISAMYKVIQAPLPALKLSEAEQSKQLDAVLARACAKQPQKRYQTTKELWEALAAVVSRKTPPAPELPAEVEIDVSSLQAQVPQETPRIKAGAFQAVLDYIRHAYGDVGLQTVREHLGPARVDRIINALPTEWIDSSEMQRLYDTVNELFDDGSLRVMRNVGGHFAALALGTIYKAFLTPAGPETMLKRAQIMFSAISSMGEMKVQQIDERSWQMKLVNEPALTPSLMAATAGWVQRYLELAGATAVSVQEKFLVEEGKPVGELECSFVAAAP